MTSCGMFIRNLIPSYFAWTHHNLLLVIEKSAIELLSGQNGTVPNLILNWADTLWIGNRSEFIAFIVRSEGIWVPEKRPIHNNFVMDCKFFGKVEIGCKLVTFTFVPNDRQIRKLLVLFAKRALDNIQPIVNIFKTTMICYVVNKKDGL